MQPNVLGGPRRVSRIGVCSWRGAPICPAMSTSTHKRLRIMTSAVLAILILIPTATFIYKVTVLDYRIANILP